MAGIIRNAKPSDVKEVMNFLADARVSNEGIEELIDFFVIGEDTQGNISSVLGFEPLQSIGILRSLVVHASVKEEELMMLFQHVYNLAKSKKLSTLMLITNKEVFIPLLELMGFEQISGDSIPKELENSSHVKHVGILNDVFYMKRAI
ncbi:hypothetical protein [Bacillus sp. FJAT-49736]|uniref:GNAT family N-acetyltransferase n=1 Tax=Bacillus sp. FJAT-49736 TaxID=2833582 RepID=UPI001BCA28E3|nr:hypothetical protein [Bacillus sp. FJAT-49736]MBS4175410.1 hypothetical protein [Bacillus sp. FJAT-49736]